MAEPYTVFCLYESIRELDELIAEMQAENASASSLENANAMLTALQAKLSAARMTASKSQI